MSSTISQTQLGCLGFCFGSTTVSALDPQLNEADIDELLGELEAFSAPTLDPIPAVDENVVDQTSGQYQDGPSTTDGLDPRVRKRRARPRPTSRFRASRLRY